MRTPVRITADTYQLVERAMDQEAAARAAALVLGPMGGRFAGDAGSILPRQEARG